MDEWGFGTVIVKDGVNYKLSGTIDSTDGASPEPLQQREVQGSSQVLGELWIAS